MSKEVMKLALEALENSRSLEPVDVQWVKGKRHAAITALREALAEQPAQQEPVAWISGHRFDELRQGFPVMTTLTKHKAFKDDVAFYTSPPAQRKPLTDEEIESINVRLAGKRDLSRLFARAIEAAHGIKENT